MIKKSKCSWIYSVYLLLVLLCSNEKMKSVFGGICANCAIILSFGVNLSIEIRTNFIGRAILWNILGFSCFFFFKYTVFLQILLELHKNVIVKSIL